MDSLKMNQNKISLIVSGRVYFEFPLGVTLQTPLPRWDGLQSRQKDEEATTESLGPQRWS